MHCAFPLSLRIARGEGARRAGEGRLWGRVSGPMTRRHVPGSGLNALKQRRYVLNPRAAW